MLIKVVNSSLKIARPVCFTCRSLAAHRRYFSDNLEDKYSVEQREKILQVINDSDADTLSRYDISKVRAKKFKQWKNSNGQMKSLTDLEYIEGFSEKSAKKLFSSILNGPPKEKGILSNKIKGQILHPSLSERTVENCKSVLAVYVSVNSVCWSLIHTENYELAEWKYYGINYPDGKRFQIADVLDIAWRITHQLPAADIYVMKAEATTLRAAGSDPNNPKVIAVNLQKAQMIAMIVAMLNSRSRNEDSTTSEEDASTPVNDLEHKVYFLRPNLPYRLYGTLVGTEKVSTDQTVEILLREFNGQSSDNSHVYVPDTLKDMFRSQKDLEKDMLGQCFLLSLTFMDLCIYKNKDRIAKLLSVAND